VLIGSITASIENVRLPAMSTGLHDWQSKITSLKEELYVCYVRTQLLQEDTDILRSRKAVEKL
jgi:hypothetical protein